MPKTLFDKIWDAHLVARRADGRALIYMDRNLVDDVRAPHAFGQLERGGHSVRRKDLTMAVQDHSVLTDGRDANDPTATAFTDATRTAATRHGIRLFDLGDPEQGISHVVAPELGLVLPGATHVCADSHAPTVGALGALAFGCGTTELVHVLATQTMALARPRQMRIKLKGVLGRGVSAKDVILHTIAKLGIDAGRGHAVEFSGAAIAAMPVEGRFTVCNMATELGARTACVAPDETTLQWLAARPFVPVGEAWECALAAWSDLASDDDATFDQEVAIDCSALEPQITWGTDPSQVLGISERVPDPGKFAAGRGAAMENALAYMGLAPGMALAGLPVDRVFIGSCTNSRLPDLQAAAQLVRGRRVAEGVIAMIVPGSTTVKRAAEAEGLDRIFRDAGFFWGESGCSMCAGGNGDRGAPGERCVSTTNRNFEHRQGPKVRTHLVSPETAAATALTGRITDVRQLAAGAA